MEVPISHKTLARYLKSALGGDGVKVVTYWDEAEKSSIAILSASDSPTTGVTTHATIGLSDVDIETSVGDAPLRVELLIAARDEFTDTANILSTCAFNVMNSGAPLLPDSVHIDAVGMYLKNTAMRHVMLYDPFLWNLETQRLPDRTVAWLLALPISESERIYGATRGASALAELFQQMQIDVFDLERAAAV
ncbi:suppressor of fused domain protein [Glacieibacterium megasporae]|uniref:suppressor of fused domain protein n=1 Tax=Glacieibacterium megasporae TaxID=2835787 RepID=UPI001C1E4BC8|nr:suppressor of fused domain protein [Polymorphobacter megasporae]UAJ12725.1 suppressor of fused domain protein [Polymorphobacter megasporae]